LPQLHSFSGINRLAQHTWHLLNLEDADIRGTAGGAQIYTAGLQLLQVEGACRVHRWLTQSS